MKTLAEYEANEAKEAYRRTLEIERAPIADRKAARDDWFTAMKDPSIVAERLEWLIDGNYGYGQMMEAKGILSRPRMNREAALCQLIARYEWLCPARFAAEAWNALDQSQKAALSAAVAKVIADA